MPFTNNLMRQNDKYMENSYCLNRRGECYVLYDVVVCDVVWYSVVHVVHVWSCMVQCGMVWYCVVSCGIVWFDIACHALCCIL